MASFSNTDDIIDLRDVMARVEELEAAQTDYEHDEDGNRTAAEWASEFTDEAQELATLSSLLYDLAGYGGDEQWRGDWYPINLIHETHFVDYCEELVKDIDALPRDIPPYLVIDWEATADNLLVDYSTVEFGDQHFLYR